MVDHGWIKLGDTHVDIMESFFPSDKLTYLVLTWSNNKSFGIEETPPPPHPLLGKTPK